MPLIQELPNTSTATTPGWSLVVDTGYDPSKEAIMPSGSRDRKQRAGRNPNAGQSAAANSKHLAKIQAYIEGLKRDAPKDSQITVPGKPRDVTARGMTVKMTSGVKKILQSQKTFTNHLNDEEALLANRAPEPHQSAAAAQRHLSNKAHKIQPPSKRQSMSKKGSFTKDTADADKDTTMVDADDDPPHPASNPDDEDPFYKSTLPELPSEAEIEALIAAPALSFSAAAAAPSATTAPPRHFCSICGYWGRVKCLRCNERVCGLDCKLRHEEGQCYPY